MAYVNNIDIPLTSGTINTRRQYCTLHMDRNIFRSLTISYMKILPLEIEVTFVKRRNVWKTIGLTPNIEDASLHRLGRELSQLGYVLDSTDGYSHAWFVLDETK
jgi:hypothetical protein